MHLPLLRHGVPYKSLDVIRVPHHRTRETFAEMSQANAGLIRRDLREEAQAVARRALEALPGFSTSGVFSAMAGTQSECTPGELLGRTTPSDCVRG